MTRSPKLQPYSDEEIATDPDLAAALLRDAEPLLAIEQQIKALREQKADLFDDLRCSRFKPEFAKAWVSAQMVDEDKDAAKAEKEMALDRVVSAMEAARAGKSRARAGVRPREAKPAARQEEFDPATGEVHETGEVRAFDGIANAETSSAVPAHEAGGAPLNSREEPAPHTIERSGPLLIHEELPSPSEPTSLTDCAPALITQLACANPAAGQLQTGQSGMTALTPYRVTDSAPAPVAPVEDADLPAFLDRRNWRDGKPAEAVS